MEITFTSVGKKPMVWYLRWNFLKAKNTEECSALIETSLPYFVTLPGINKLVVIIRKLAHNQHTFAAFESTSLAKGGQVKSIHQHSPLIKVWGQSCSIVCCALLFVHFSFAITLMWKSDSWLFRLVCLPGVSWLFCGSSSRCHGFVWSLWLWYFLTILTYFLSLIRDQTKLKLFTNVIGNHYKVPNQQIKSMHFVIWYFCMILFHFHSENM